MNRLQAKDYIGPLMVSIACLATGCLPSLTDGSTPPVMAYELDGTWCSYKLCLTVHSPQQTGLPEATYQWSSPACNETGTLTGGLEFTPDIGPLCMAPEYDLYSAAGQWTATGLRLKVDASTNQERATSEHPTTVTLNLEYRTQQ